MNASSIVHDQVNHQAALPAFKAGDNITVNYKIVRVPKGVSRALKADVIKRQGNGLPLLLQFVNISDGVGG